jgi:hypothetical protein
MLVYGASRQEISDLAQKQWGVSRRTAQDYLHTVQQRLAGEAVEEDRLVALRLSQLQRDKLVGLALRYVHSPTEDFDPKVLQALTRLISAVRGLLDSRDRTAAEIQHLVEERLRHAEKVVPEREAPYQAVSTNGHASAAKEKVRVRRGHDGVAATPATREPEISAPVSRVNLRPPLPAGDSAAGAVGGGHDPNCRIHQEIELESEESEAVETACAFCAGGP